LKIEIGKMEFTKEMGLYCQSQNMGGQNLSLMEQANIALVILW